MKMLLDKGVNNRSPLQIQSPFGKCRMDAKINVSNDIYRILVRVHCAAISRKIFPNGEKLWLLIYQILFGVLSHISENSYAALQILQIFYALVFTYFQCGKLKCRQDFQCKKRASLVKKGLISR